MISLKIFHVGYALKVGTDLVLGFGLYKGNPNEDVREGVESLILQDHPEGIPLYISIHELTESDIQAIINLKTETL